MRISLLFLLFGILFDPLSAQTPYSSDKDRPPTFAEISAYKEVLKFEVKYGFFKLGWIEIQAIRDTVYNGQDRYLLQTQIRSNSRIPFVGKEIDYFSSIFHEDTEGRLVTDYYWKDNLDEEKYKEIEYVFNRFTSEVIYKEEDDSRDTLDLVEPATAGQLIFLYGRIYAGSSDSYELPVYVSKELGYVRSNNTTQKKRRRIPAFDKPVETYFAEGDADLDGPFGFSGKFKAWYLADDLRVPLESHFKVFLGNVKIRLIEYTRTSL